MRRERRMNPKCQTRPGFDTFSAKSAHLTGLKMRRITRAVSSAYPEAKDYGLGIAGRGRASQQKRPLIVRFGSGADVNRSPANVRFTPESGHNAVQQEMIIFRQLYFLRAMPHVPVNDEPGFSLIRASPVRNAFGGQVIGSTARLRRRTLGSGWPLKGIR